MGDKREAAGRLQNRYIELADEIARLAREAAELEIQMGDNYFYPMSINVYNNLVSAHAAIIHPCLHTLSNITDVPVEVVDG